MSLFIPRSNDDFASKTRLSLESCGDTLPAYPLPVRTRGVGARWHGWGRGSKIVARPLGRDARLAMIAADASRDDAIGRQPQRYSFPIRRAASRVLSSLPASLLASFERRPALSHWKQRADLPLLKRIVSRERSPRAWSRAKASPIIPYTCVRVSWGPSRQDRALSLARPSPAIAAGIASRSSQRSLIRAQAHVSGTISPQDRSPQQSPDGRDQSRSPQSHKKPYQTLVYRFTQTGEKLRS